MTTPGTIVVLWRKPDDTTTLVIDLEAGMLNWFNWFSNRREYLVAAAALTMLYFALFAGRFYSIDGLLMFYQGRSLLESQSIKLDPPLYWGQEFSDSKYGLGLSLMYIPGLAMFGWLRPWMYQATNDHDVGVMRLDLLYVFAGAPVQIFIAVASALLVGLFCRQLHLGRSASLWSMAFYGLGSPAIVYTRMDFSQPLLGLILIGALYAAFLFRRDGSFRYAVLSAVLIGYAVLTRPVEGVLLLPATLMLLVPVARVRHFSSLQWQAVGLSVGGLGLGLLATIMVNYARYGSGFATGYEGEGFVTPLWVGVSGLLISPARGLLWAFPAMILIPFGIRLIWQSQRALVLSFMGLVIVLVLLMGAWCVWWGGWCWGPRLMIQTLPLLAVLAGAGLASFPQRLHARVAAVLIAAGLLWALPGLTVDLGGYSSLFKTSDAQFQLVSYPPLSAWHFLKGVFAQDPVKTAEIDIMWFRFARVTDGMSLFPFVLFLVAVLVLSAYLFMICRRLPADACDIATPSRL